MPNSRYPRVAGRCPMGCGETLFLGEAGCVTCSYISCPNPSRVDTLLHQFDERCLVFVVKESDLHWNHNNAAAPGVGVTTFMGTSGSPDRLPAGWDKGNKK